MSLEFYETHVKKLKRVGDRYMGLCPLHKDTRPSFNINPVTWSWYCHACGIGGGPRQLAEPLGVPIPDLGDPPGKSIAKIYDFVDEDGKLLFQSVKYEPGSQPPYHARQPDGRGGWTWNLKGVRRVLYRLPEIKGHKTVYLPEGEKDADSLWALGLPATTNPMGAGKWRDEYANQLLQAGAESVVVLADNDEPGRNHAEEVARSCQQAGLHVQKVVHFPDLSPKGDVTDWLADGRTIEELLSYIGAQTHPEPPTEGHPKVKDEGSIDDLQAQVTDILLSEGHVHSKYKRLGTLVLETMRREGSFYRTIEPQYLYFNNAERRLYNLDEEASIFYLHARTGLNPTDKPAKFVLAEARTAAARTGTLTEVDHLARIDMERARLFVNDRKGGIYVLGGQKIELSHNGAGALFLEEPGVPTWQYVPADQRPPSVSLDFLINRTTHFANVPEAEITANDFRLLFRLWILTLFFENLQPTKPICSLVGPIRSGKTVALKAVGQLLFGDDWAPTRYEKESDFQTDLANSLLVCWDGCDGKIKWVTRALSLAATGQTITRRRLYTTCDTFRKKVRCFVALTSMDPHFKDADVRDRMLLFRCQPLPDDGIVDEVELLKIIYKDRDAILSHVVDELHARLPNVMGRDWVRSSFRIATWPTIAHALCRGEEERNRLLDLLSKQERLKRDFAMEDHPLVESLMAWVEAPGNNGREVTTSVLLQELIEQEKAAGRKFAYKDTVGFGVAVTNVIGTLQDHVQVTEVRKGANIRHLTFNRLGQGDEGQVHRYRRLHTALAVDLDLVQEEGFSGEVTVRYQDGKVVDVRGREEGELPL